MLFQALRALLEIRISSALALARLQASSHHKRANAYGMPCRHHSHHRHSGMHCLFCHCHTCQKSKTSKTHLLFISFIFLPFSNRSSILIKTLIKNRNLHRTRPCISSLVPVCCKVLESSSQGQAFPSTLYVSLQQFWEKHVGVCCYCIM